MHVSSLFFSLTLLALEARIRPPMPHGRPINYQLTTMLRCFSRYPTTTHIALWEDDSIPFYRRDALIDWKTYNLGSFYDEKATIVKLKGLLLDQPWDGVTEPYVYVATNCTHGFYTMEFCLELDEVYREDGVNNYHDIPDLFGPDFEGLQKLLKPCDYFQDVENMRQIFKMRTFAVFALLAVAAYAQSSTTPEQIESTTPEPDVEIIIKDAEIVKRHAQPTETTPEPAIPADHVVVKRQYNPEEQQEVIQNESADDNTDDVTDDETQPEYPKKDDEENDEYRNKRDAVYATDATEKQPDIEIEVLDAPSVAADEVYEAENQQYRNKRDTVYTTDVTEKKPDIEIEVFDAPDVAAVEDNETDVAPENDYPVENTADQQYRKKRDAVPTTSATTEIEPDVKIEITGPIETPRAKRDVSPEKHEKPFEAGVGYIGSRARRFSGDHEHEHEEDHEHAYPDCSCLRKHPHLPLFTNLHRHCQYPGKPRPTHPPCSSCGHTHPPKQPCHGHSHGAVYHHHHVHVVPQHHHAGPIHRVHHDVHHHFVPKRPHYRAPCDRPHHYDNVEHHDQMRTFAVFALLAVAAYAQIDTTPKAEALPVDQPKNTIEKRQAYKDTQTDYTDYSDRGNEGIAVDSVPTKKDQEKESTYPRKRAAEGTYPKHDNDGIAIDSVPRRTTETPEDNDSTYPRKRAAEGTYPKHDNDGIAIDSVPRRTTETPEDNDSTYPRKRAAEGTYPKHDNDGIAVDSVPRRTTETPEDNDSTYPRKRAAEDTYPEQDELDDTANDVEQKTVEDNGSSYPQKRDASPEKATCGSDDNSEDLKTETGATRMRRHAYDDDDDEEEYDNERVDDNEPACPSCSSDTLHPPCSSCGHTHCPKKPCNDGGAVHHHHHHHVVPEHRHAPCPVHRVRHDVHHHFVPKTPHYRAQTIYRRCTAFSDDRDDQY